jgi:YbbR domain-containing protein
MLKRGSRFLLSNLNTLFVALVLALTIWVLAVLATDPNEIRAFPGGIAIDVIEEDEGLILLSSLPGTITLRLAAPRSVWEQLEAEGGISARLDLSGLAAGQHSVPVEVVVDASPVRVLDYAPRTIDIVLENMVSKTVLIQPSILGSPALGFQLEVLSISEFETTVSGPESLVSEVAKVHAELDIEGTRESVNAEVSLIPVNEEGLRVTGVTLNPDTVTIYQPVIQSGGYRDVAVKLETSGLLANGYRITNVSVSPPTLTIFSADPQVVAEMPGFVSTHPLDLSGANDDITTRLALILPEGVSVVGEEQSVTVQISIAGIETSISLTVPVEAIGLGPGLGAIISPESIDLILTGPLPVLDDLFNLDVRVFVDLSDLPEGTHLVEPQAEILANGVVVESISPVTLEVVIGRALTPGAGTQSPRGTVTGTVSPTPTPTFTPSP